MTSLVYAEADSRIRTRIEDLLTLHKLAVKSPLHTYSLMSAGRIINNVLYNIFIAPEYSEVLLRYQPCENGVASRKLHNSLLYSCLAEKTT
jgi:hypothetical protein